MRAAKHGLLCLCVHVRSFDDDAKAGICWSDRSVAATNFPFYTRRISQTVWSAARTCVCLMMRRETANRVVRVYVQTNVGASHPQTFHNPHNDVAVNEFNVRIA